MLQFVASDTYFVTLDLQSSSRITSRKLARQPKLKRDYQLSRPPSPKLWWTAFALALREGRRLKAGAGVAPAEAELMRLA